MAAICRARPSAGLAGHEQLRRRAGTIVTAEYAKAKGVTTNMLHRAKPRTAAYRRRSEVAEESMDWVKQREDEEAEAPGSGPWRITVRPGETFRSSNVRKAGARGVARSFRKGVGGGAGVDGTECGRGCRRLCSNGMWAWEGIRSLRTTSRKTERRMHGSETIGHEGNPKAAPNEAALRCHTNSYTIYIPGTNLGRA